MSITLTFRTTDNSKWGAGKGFGLSAAEIDLNFWNLAEAIEAIQADIPDPISIANVTVAGTNMTFVMSDNSTIGPIPLPVLKFRYTGAWRPNFTYAVLDTFFVNGFGIFTTQIAHTSGATFDPDIQVTGSDALLQLFGAAGFTTDASLGALIDVHISSDVADNSFLAYHAGTTDVWEPMSPEESARLIGSNLPFEGLSNVEIDSSLADGDVPIWNDAVKKWIPGAQTSGGGGDTIINNVGATALAGLTDVELGSDASPGMVFVLGDDGRWIGRALNLEGLANVLIDSSIGDGYVLKWSDSLKKWVAGPQTGGGGGGSGVVALAGLNDVLIDSSLMNGALLMWSEPVERWIAAEPGSTNYPAGGGGGGSGISDVGTWNGTTAYSAGDAVEFTLNGRSVSALCYNGVSAPAGVAPSISASNTAGISNGSSTASCALTAGANDDLICFLVYAQQGGGGAADKIKLTGPPTASGLTFTSRAIENIQDPADVNERIALELWTARATGAFSGTISGTLSQAVDDGVVIAFSVSGATVPFDSNVSVPNFNSGSTSSLTTDDAFDLIIYVSSGENVSLQPAPSGFSTIATVGNGSGFRTSNMALYAMQVTTTQSTVTIGGSGAQTTNLLDAFAHSVTDNPSPELDPDHWIVGAGGWVLADLFDISESALADGDYLVFREDSTGGHWRNEAGAGGVDAAPLYGHLGSDVAIGDTSGYHDGPSVAQDNEGVFFAIGHVTMTGSSFNTFNVKLWDGATLIDSIPVWMPTDAQGCTANVSGIITDPAGDIKISVKANNNTDASIVHNASGLGNDSSLTVYRIK